MHLKLKMYIWKSDFGNCAVLIPSCVGADGKSAGKVQLSFRVQPISEKCLKYWHIDLKVLDKLHSSGMPSTYFMHSDA